MIALVGILALVIILIIFAVVFRKMMFEKAWLSVPIAIICTGVCVYLIIRSYKRSEINYLLRREKKFKLILIELESRYF
jgi:uncharacterized membrane protein